MDEVSRNLTLGFTGNLGALSIRPVPGIRVPFTGNLGALLPGNWVPFTGNPGALRGRNSLSVLKIRDAK